MNLVQQDIVYKFKTFELLESMIELSRINIDRFQRMGVDEANRLFYGMTGFNTGRQTGKSTAIARYLKENNAMVVSPNRVLQKCMAQLLQSGNCFNLCVGDFSSQRIFRGLRGEYDLIFDECSLEDIHLCVRRLGEYTGIEIRSIVRVGS